MSRYLIDTNHLSEAIRRVSVLRDLVQSREITGDEFFTIGPALCELEVGIQRTKDVDGNRQRLGWLLQCVEVVPIDTTIAIEFGRLSHLAKSRGREMSQVDRMLAAVAILLDATLLTTDRDFEGLPEVAVEDWLPDAGTRRA